MLLLFVISFLIHLLKYSRLKKNTKVNVVLIRNVKVYNSTALPNVFKSLLLPINNVINIIILYTQTLIIDYYDSEKLVFKTIA